LRKSEFQLLSMSEPHLDDLSFDLRHFAKSSFASKPTEKIAKRQIGMEPCIIM